MASESVTLFNGEFADQIAARHRAASYGDGVFETVAVNDGGERLLWQAHLDRLQRGADTLGLPLDIERLEREVDYALSLGPGGQRVLKISWLRAGEARGYTPPVDARADCLISVTAWTPPGDGFQLGQSDVPLSPQESLRGLKTHNSLEYVLAARTLVEQELDEATVCDAEGFLVECTRSNLFWVNGNGTLVTPKMERCGIPGVVRALILERALGEGLPIKLTRATPEALSQAREIFVTNSLLGVQPVTRFRDRELNDHNLAERVRDFIQDAIL